jgi:predicted N-acetyltransferase YhbS
MEIKVITTGTVEYEAMVDLRMKVLLGPIGIRRSYIDPTKEKEDILIVAVEGGKMVGCCILSRVDATTMQLRQMAVDTSLQKKGIGAAIIFFAEELARKQGVTTMMMNARDAVLEFYKKCGYARDGEQFLEVGIGHHKMQKRLV